MVAANADLSFITPEAGLVGLVALVALATLVVSELRSRRVCRALGLVPRSPLAAVVPGLALTLVGGLVGLAASQPVLSTVRATEGRSDAEVTVVFDVTRSMLAKESRTGVMRLDRARTEAKELRARLPEIPFGIASLTDRLLPHLLPSVSQNAFTSVTDRAIGIERPPPDRRSRSRATALGALAALSRQNFFGPEARRRAAVVFTDGETLPVDVGTLRARFFRGRIVPLFVHVWNGEERVFLKGGAVERQYRPDPDSPATLAALADAVGGRVFAEDDMGRVADAIDAVLGEGPLGPHGRDLQSRQLAPYAAGAAFLPLAFVLWRRNLSR